jgi:hypothetical protein
LRTLSTAKIIQRRWQTNWWNNTDSGNPKNWKKIDPSQDHFEEINPTPTDLGSNPGLRGERTLTNLQSHGAALVIVRVTALPSFETSL